MPYRSVLRFLPAVPALTLLAAGAAFCGSAAAAETPPAISVTADRMEYFTEDRTVVFQGNALAVQEDVTLSADTMRVVLAEEGERDAGAIERIDAEGNVTFRQLLPESGAERFATGEKGVYSAAEGLVTLTGNPKVWEGKNVIVGEVMTFFVEEHRFLVEGEVGLTVFPEREGPEGEKE